MKFILSGKLPENCCENCVRVVVELTFPHDYDSPAKLPKFRFLSAIPQHRLGKLRCPEFLAGLGSSGFWAIRMSMPIAAVYENCGLVSWNNNVWPTREIGRMQPESEASPMQHRSKGFFRPSVLAPDAGHVPASLFWRNTINQSRLSWAFATNGIERLCAL